ncbi:TPA: hypothetical protein IAA92_06410 [Candidatus Galligastranaerophilus intestinigallinarum]|nr:hypothetical protein [Candidatus Galligastranaerophilus intestinigallinarum]
MKKIVKTITAYVPGTMCNLRCNYCYISNCADDPHSRKPTYDYPLETMIKAFNPKRLGGIAEIHVISGGETLIDDTVVPFIHGLLKYGHVVTVVTNLTLNNRIDELLDFPKEYLKHLIVKGSLHWLELKRLNKVDDFFNNMNKVLNSGASSFPFIVMSQDYMPYIDEIERTCKEKLNSMPHCTPSIVFEEKTINGNTTTNPECTEEFVNFVNERFDSEIFRASVKYLNVDIKKIFCYAGEWSFGVNLKTGGMVKCHNCPEEVNFYKNLNKMPKLLPIGNNCQIANCALQYNFIAEGLIPEGPITPLFGDMLSRPNLINEEVREMLNVRFSDIHKQYSLKKQKKINRKVALCFAVPNNSLMDKILYRVWKKLDKILRKKGIIK